MMSAFLRILTACALAACAADDPAVDAIQLSPATAALPVGGSVQLSATPTARGDAVEAEVAWSSSNQAVVRVSDGGLATAVARGRAEIAAVAGAARAAVTIDVVDGAVVGPAGASITALDGRVTLEIPAGALAADTAIAVAPVTLPVVDPRVVGGAAFTVSGYTSSTPATLRVTFTPDEAPIGVPDGWLRLARRDGEAWSETAITVAGGTAVGPLTASGLHALRVAGSPGPCTAAEHRQLDFWVGRWTLFVQGNIEAGTSTVSLEPSGCLIEEDYHSPAGGNGRSISFFSPATGKWHQTYLLKGSPAIRLSGSYVGGKLVLYSADLTSRWTWVDLGGSVEQVAAASSDGGQTWTTLFDATYTH